MTTAAARTQPSAVLTERQQSVLAFIVGYLEDNGYPPSRQEIQRKFGFVSPNAVTDHLKALERKGAIELVPKIARGLRLL